MRRRFRYRDGQIVGPDGLPMLNQAERAAEPAAPMYVGDALPRGALQSQVTGRMHDSKSELRKEYRWHGVEEVGGKHRQTRTWAAEKAKREKHRGEIKAALYRAHSRMGHGAP